MSGTNRDAAAAPAGDRRRRDAGEPDGDQRDGQQPIVHRDGARRLASRRPARRRSPTTPLGADTVRISSTAGNRRSRLGPSASSCCLLGDPSPCHQLAWTGWPPPSQLRDAIGARLAQLGLAAPTDLKLERPRNPDHGDWAVNCFPLAKGSSYAGPALAAALADSLNADPPAHLAKAEAVGGFVNFRLHADLAPRRAAPRGRRGHRRLRPRRRRAPAAASTSSSSRPTPPARCTPATAAGPPTATRWPGSWPAPAGRCSASTT